jgi:hypothetical protein
MSNQPVTSASDQQPVRTRNHVAGVVRFSPRQIRNTVSEVEGFNAKFAVIVTSAVGTMACAYLFAALAMISLPAILIQANVLKQSDVPKFFTKPGLILIVAWVAQTFLQLVLLSIILVGQRVQSAASDARGMKEFQDTEVILDRLDTHTTGGITEVLEAIRALEKKALSSS